MYVWADFKHQCRCLHLTISTIHPPVLIYFIIVVVAVVLVSIFISMPYKPNKQFRFFCCLLCVHLARFILCKFAFFSYSTDFCCINSMWQSITMHRVHTVFCVGWLFNVVIRTTVVAAAVVVIKCCCSLVCCHWMQPGAILYILVRTNHLHMQLDVVGCFKNLFWNFVELRKKNLSFFLITFLFLLAFNLIFYFMLKIL